MNVLGTIIFILLLVGILFLIAFEIVSIVKRVKEYRKSKNENNEKKGE